MLLLKGRSGLCRPPLLPPLSAHSKANSILCRLQLQAGAKSCIQFQQTSWAVIELVSTLHWWMSCDVFIYFGGLYQESTKKPPSSWGKSTLGMTQQPAKGIFYFIFNDRLEVKVVRLWKTDYFRWWKCYWNAKQQTSLCLLLASLPCFTSCITIQPGRSSN